MLLMLALPRISANIASVFVESIHVDVGAALVPGAKLLDLRVDLSAVMPHDCPPVSFYRVALRERAWLRRLNVARHDAVSVGAVMGYFTTAPDEPLEAQPARAVRVTIVGIVHQGDWWRGKLP